jgi:hypothetical protein
VDELIPYDVGQRLRADWCARGTAVRWTSLPLGHVTTVTAGAVPAVDWLADRFSGKPADGNCS